MSCSCMGDDEDRTPAGQLFPDEEVTRPYGDPSDLCSTCKTRTLIRIHEGAPSPESEREVRGFRTCVATQDYEGDEIPGASPWCYCYVKQLLKGRNLCVYLGPERRGAHVPSPGLSWDGVERRVSDLKLKPKR